MRQPDPSGTEQLREALAAREAELEEARARLAALEVSTSLQVGRALTTAAKGPRRRLLRLPRDLYRLWRGRRSGGSRPRGAEPVRSYTAERREARLLSGIAGPCGDRLLVLGVLSADARTALAAHAEVVTLRPHNTQIVFDAVDADLLLVTASAAAPGGPWTHVGDPAVTDRTRALDWAVKAAAARGIPSVLLLDAPCPPALRQLGFDHVHDGALGAVLQHPTPADGDARHGARLLALATRNDPTEAVG